MKRLLTAVSLCSVLLSACSPAVRTARLEAAGAINSARRNIVASGKLSDETVQALRMQGVLEEAAIENPDLITTVEGFKYLSPLRQRFTASELALANAMKFEGGPQTVSRYLESARLALEGMLSDDCQVAVNFLCDNFKVFYLKSTAEVLTALGKNSWEPSGIAGERYALSVEPATQFEDLKRYDSVVPSGLVSFTGLSNRHLRFGLGLPLSACRKKNRELPSDKYLPEAGTCLPVTAVLDFETPCPETGCPAKLKLLNAFTTDTVTALGKELPLAANFSTPYASLIEKTGLTDMSGMFSAFDGSEKLLERTGFYTTEPYDSGKIPLITVHGLFSSPLTWIGLQNDLMGDPVIRKHFQIWNYMYPTNLPIVVNARTFREKLDELQKHLIETTPEREGLRDMVIIAHSMGGLLTKTAVAHDSAPMERFLFENPDKIDALDEEVRTALGQYLSFSCKPYVSRVIFVATPFRGSTLATNWIGWIGRQLITLPKKALQAPARMAHKLKDLIRPDLREQLENSDFTSVRGLSPKNPMLQGLSEVSIASDVPFHLIEGDQGLGGGKLATDGVVAFESSHLEGAQSELIVPADHTAHAHPLAVQEIKRILYLHLDHMAEQKRKSVSAKKRPRPVK